MIVLRQREYGTAGKVWAGTKGAVKTGLKGAAWGAVLVPGNGLAYLAGKKKLAAGITGVGALVGGGIGAKLGWDNAVDKYKYEHDPKYREKVDKEEKERVGKAIEQFMNEDLYFANEFDYISWKNLSKEIPVPEEFLKYVKFYETWSRKIEQWYSSIDQSKLKGCHEILEFKEIFPIPIDAELSKRWYDYDDEGDLCLATVNSAGDDGWLYYSTESKEYGWDLPGGYRSLRHILTKQLDYSNGFPLSSIQVRLIGEFKTKVNSL